MKMNRINHSCCLGLLFLVLSLAPLAAGVYYDLGRPVVGAWVGPVGLAWDPVLQKNLLWTQESSQDGAVLFALDLETGAVVEEHDVPAREIGRVLVAKNDVLYFPTYSGLNHPGNELLRFDPKRREIERLGLPDVPRNRLVDGAIGRDGHVYLGTHQQGRLYRFRTDVNRWEDLGPKVPPPVRPTQNVWLRGIQNAPDGRILAVVRRTPPAEIVCVDPGSGDFHVVTSLPPAGFTVAGDRIVAPTAGGIDLYDASFERVQSLPLRSFQGGWNYPERTRLGVLSTRDPDGLLVQLGRDIVRLRFSTRRLEKLATLPSAGGCMITPDESTAVIVHRPLRSYTVVDLATARARNVTSRYAGKRGSQVCGLNKASDGSIYGTNIIGMHIFRHDPESSETLDLGHVGWSGGEVYNTIDFEGQIYFGTYGGGYWGVYDPKRPWQPDFAGRGSAIDANPRQLTQLGGDTPNAANRPFEYVVGPDQKIYIACRANYGHAGGTLAEFDPSSGATRLFRDEKRSVQTVTADDRYVFGGTNIRGGRGSGERAATGTLFVHDPRTGQRVFEQPVVPDAKAIVSVRYNSHSKRVYATTDNQVLVEFHPRAFYVLGTWKIRSAGTPLAGVPEDVGMLHITAASDGNIYGVTHNDLYRLNLATGQIEYLDPPPMRGLYQIVEGPPGEFYMGAGTHLLKYVLNDPAYYR